MNLENATILNNLINLYVRKRKIGKFSSSLWLNFDAINSIRFKLQLHETSTLAADYLIFFNI